MRLANIITDIIPILIIFPSRIASFSTRPRNIFNSVGARGCQSTLNKYISSQSSDSASSPSNMSLRATLKTSNTPIENFPNWRSLPNDGSDSSFKAMKKLSHFIHTLPSGGTSNGGVSNNERYVSASWSNEAYEKALSRYDAFISCTDSYIEPFIVDALNSLDHALRLYGPESVIGSFNGGKDAVVILELILAAHANFYRNLNSENGNESSATPIVPVRPRVIYFNNKLEFPEVFEFVQHSVLEYDLDMVAFKEGVGFVGGLDILVKQNFLIPDEDAGAGVGASRTHPMAFVLGTRAADPNAGKQGTFAPSSSYMPPFMRVNPILKWTYGHVWHFLRLYKLPYCSLYDEGYTSLGTVKDTLPCPALKKVHVDDNSEEFWPAYMLKDWEQERAGRIKKDKKKVKNTSSKEDKIKQRDDDGISKCSTVLSLPKTTEPSIVTAGAPTEAVEPVGNLSDSDSDVSSIGSNSTISQRTVGIIIIGDEILKGLTPDTNTHAAATALNSNNVPLARVVVVSDDQDEIISEILKMNEQVDVIITSGGVGPTHDDVTIKSVAAALESDMELNEEMAQLLRKKMGDDGSDEKDLSAAQKKMATLPACSKLRYLSGEDEEWPVLQCQNVFILPGVPQFFEKKVKHVASYLSTEFGRRVAFKVVLSVDENSIVPILNNVVENHTSVTFGSYPFVDHKDYKTVVTLEGGRESDVNVKVALADLVNGLPPGSVLRVDNNNDLTF